MEKKRVSPYIIAFYAVIAIGSTMSAFGVKQGLDRRAALAASEMAVEQVLTEQTAEL